MKKLLFIVNVDWFFVSHRLPIALEAISQGYEVHIACSTTDKREMLEGLGLRVHPIPLSRSGVGIFSELKALISLFIVLQHIKPDITHCITIKPVLYGNLLARFLRVKGRVSSISGLGFIFIASGVKARVLRFFISCLYRTALLGSQKVIFQNTSDRDILLKIGAVSDRQIELIRGSGVNLETYIVTEEPIDKPVVMLVARLLIDKGVIEFAEAAKIIQAKRSDVRMVLVGDVDPGNPKSLLPMQIEEWVSSGILEHWGYSDDINVTIAQSNIMVLPSYREGLPKSLIEAAACGRAVVTTDVPGCRDAIIENETGLLVPARSASSLADAIIKLVDDKPLRRTFAANGRRLAEKAFDINDVVDTHLFIYRNL